MSVQWSASREALHALRRLVEGSPPIDWRKVSLDEPASLDAPRWDGADLSRDAALPLLKGFQRLARILPASEEHRAWRLMERGLHSAVQIAALPRDELLRLWDELFPGEATLASAVHCAALSRRSDLLLHHINDLQHNEPHYRAARFR